MSDDNEKVKFVDEICSNIQTLSGYSIKKIDVKNKHCIKKMYVDKLSDQYVGGIYRHRDSIIIMIDVGAIVIDNASSSEWRDDETNDHDGPCDIRFLVCIESAPLLTASNLFLYCNGCSVSILSPTELALKIGELGPEIMYSSCSYVVE